MRDLHEDTTGPGQRREGGGGDFPKHIEVTYAQSNCNTRHKTNRSETVRTHTEQSLAHLAAHVADMLQQGLQDLQVTVTVVLTPGAGCTLARSCSNTSAKTGKGGLLSHLVQELLCVEAEGLTWWSVRRSASQRLTALCIEPRSVVLVKVDVREVQHLAHWRARLQRMGRT